MQGHLKHPCFFDKVLVVNATGANQSMISNILANHRINNPLVATDDDEISIIEM